MQESASKKDKNSIVEKMDIGKILPKLTLDEKVRLVAGANFMDTFKVERLAIPAISMSDGPHGLRKQKGESDNGITLSEPATAFPTAATVANSFDPALSEEIGKAIGEEATHYGVSVVLGPGANIKRNPLGGRNFEYFSEDPLLSGKMAAGEIRGLEERGIGACLKHFALNNSENYRFMGNSVADMRAMREIYLKSFEIAVKEGRPSSVMSSYNRINGTFASENEWLLNDILRGEWGFDGLVMTDWGAMHSRVPSLKAGLDLEMPGDTSVCRRWIKDAIEDGELDEACLDKAVTNVLKLVNEYSLEGRSCPEADFAAHHELAKDIAIASAVLMKNDGTLPLTKESLESAFAVGDMFENMRYQGAGSSMINPTRIVGPKKAFDEEKISLPYARGYGEEGEAIDKDLIKEALLCGENRQIALVFAGLDDYSESEGADRKTMGLPSNQVRLIDALLKAGKKVVLVLFGGSPIELPFFDECAAVLDMYLPGQAGGEAVLDLILGKASPSGHLGETWPLSYKDVPFGNDFGKHVNEIYRESIYVGYRYYESAGLAVRFPFGYGLTYTTFDWSGFSFEDKGDAIAFTCKVKNIGEHEASDLVQIYSSKEDQTFFRAKKELRGWCKLRLAPGEEKTALIIVKKDDLSYFDAKKGRFVLEKGKYRFSFSSDAHREVASFSIEIDGEEKCVPYEREVNEEYDARRLPSLDSAVFEAMSGLKIPAEPSRKPLTLESPLSDFALTLPGKLLRAAVLSVPRKIAKKARKMEKGKEKANAEKGAVFLTRILESGSPRSMSMSAGKSMPYNVAEGFVDFANGHLMKAAKDFLRKVDD